MVIYKKIIFFICVVFLLAGSDSYELIEQANKKIKLGEELDSDYLYEIAQSAYLIEEYSPVIPVVV